MKIEDVHKISRRVDDPRPKNPLLVKIKLLYIRLVHNLGRDNCTYKNLKKKEKKKERVKQSPKHWALPGK